MKIVFVDNDHLNKRSYRSFDVVSNGRSDCGPLKSSIYFSKKCDISWNHDHLLIMTNHQHVYVWHHNDDAGGDADGSCHLSDDSESDRT